MKKVSGVRANIKPLPSETLNMRHCQGDLDKNICTTESDCMIESQAQYIENLQQQIFVLENEVGYLRTYLQESNKQHPSMVAEGEKMVKKLGECHVEIKNMKVEMKRKQTTIDLLRSERDRVQRYKEELEEKFRKEKCRFLEELITTRKEKVTHQERNSEVEKLLQEQKQNERNFQEEIDNLRVEIDQLKRENLHGKELITTISHEKEVLQKDLIEQKMLVEAKPSDKAAKAIEELKKKLEELIEVSEGSKRAAEHEKVLRERLLQDNERLIKRLAELESDLAQAKAVLREEQSLRSALEKVHLTAVLEASESKSKDQIFQDKVSRLEEQLKDECERSLTLALKLSDEQRFRTREEEKYTHLLERFEQREEQVKIREKENMELLRDYTYSKDQNLHLKEQLKNRDDEVVNLKHKVQEMQVSVEEFIQSTQSANRIAGERWKQLGHLAQSITALTSVIEPQS